MTYREAQKRIEEKCTYVKKLNVITMVEKMVYQTFDEKPCRKWDDEITESDMQIVAKHHRLAFKNI
jgi:hypothetical protein